VAADWAGDPGCPARPVSEPHKQFAALIRADRSAILTSYAQRLEALRSPVIGDPGSRAQAMTNAAEIITDVAESVEAAQVRIDDRYKLPTWPIGQAKAENHSSPADPLLAAMALFDLTVTSLTRHVQDNQGLLPCFIIAIQALNESLSRRIREATDAYTGYLLSRVHRAHIDERHRISRELHDRLGEGLSVGLRQLDLHEIADPQDPLNRTAIAREALAETMRRLRLVTSDLREEPVTSLEKALVHYLDSVAAKPDVRLRVSGDQTWAPPSVIDEAFLIIREAVHNALKHGAPQLVLIGVDFSSSELCAWINDDGRGFVPAESAGPPFGGTGLASMRERAALIGGQLTIASVPGHGTSVELRASLPGHRDE
jgi:signal transduction histidine kinase